MECETSKEELMQKLMAYKFAINDLSLFLDTHTNDDKALKLHNEYVSKFKDIKNEYEENYGPLSIETDVSNWQDWVCDNWPWETEVTN